MHWKQKLDIIAVAAFILASISVSCNGHEYYRKTDDIGSIIGRKYELPSIVKWYGGGKDTCIDISNANKMIVYFPNTGCTPCALTSLKHWKGIVEEFNSLTIDAKLIFIMHIDVDDENFMKILEDEQFSYPILCDQAGEFEKYNLLPKNSILNTFILDKDNKVKFVGSPLISSKMKKMFFYYLSADSNSY